MKWQDHWIRAQGYDWWYYQDHIQEGLFKQDRCTVCGKIWRPDRERFISIFGKVLMPGKGNPNWYPVWYSEQIGTYDTGHIDDHFRLVCLNHGDFWSTLIDCRTNTEIQLSSPLTRNVNYLLDIKYWTLTCLRFIWSYGGERFLYATHPIKYIRMRRWMKTEQYRKLMGEK